MKPGMPQCALTQKIVGITTGGLPMVPKHFFVVQPTSLSATYPAPFSTIFETKDVNQCVHACTTEKFPNFCTGAQVFEAPKNS